VQNRKKKKYRICIVKETGVMWRTRPFGKKNKQGVVWELEIENFQALNGGVEKLRHVTKFLLKQFVQNGI
jgi:hypothetical protein